MAERRSVLVTGFAPFGGETINPAWEIAKSLPDNIAGRHIARVQVPTTFADAIDCVTKALQREQAGIVIMLGQAGGRAGISVERVAINIDDAPIADNSGAQPIDKPIVTRAPTAYFSTLPIKAMVAAMQEEGYAATVSNTAGTFVCNHLMYGVLHFIRKRRLSTRAGFIHVPYLPVQAACHEGSPAMALADMQAAVEVAIMTAIRLRADSRSDTSNTFGALN
jgi:pyroglutamyl-peptidase